MQPVPPDDVPLDTILPAWAANGAACSALLHSALVPFAALGWTAPVPHLDAEGAAPRFPIRRSPAQWSVLVGMPSYGPEDYERDRRVPPC